MSSIENPHSSTAIIHLQRGEVKSTIILAFCVWELRQDRKAVCAGAEDDFMERLCVLQGEELQRISWHLQFQVDKISDVIHGRMRFSNGYQLAFWPHEITDDPATDDPYDLLNLILGKRTLSFLSNGSVVFNSGRPA